MALFGCSGRGSALWTRAPDLAAISRCGTDRREMYKTSVVLFLFLHLFIFFHLPQPTPIAAMSIQERTYIMVKVCAAHSARSRRHSERIQPATARWCPAWTRRQHHQPFRAARFQADCPQACARYPGAPREAYVSRSVNTLDCHFLTPNPSDYADLKGKAFFPGLIKYMASGPVAAMVWEGLDAVKTGRSMLGATNPLASAPGAFI